jgi:hypothetical protein
MKKIVTIIVLSGLFMSGANAQVPPGSSNNNSVYMGYIIRLIPAGNNGFGYDIFFKSKIVVHQSRNPFTLAPTGLRSSEDALKLAHWQVQQLWHDKQQARIMNRLVSKDVARQLNITIN